MDICVKSVSRQQAGSKGKARPWTGHEVPECGKCKALEITYIRHGRHRHNNFNVPSTQHKMPNTYKP
jgi:hypothetical protein